MKRTFLFFAATALALAMSAPAHTEQAREPGVSAKAFPLLAFLRPMLGTVIQSFGGALITQMQQAAANNGDKNPLGGALAAAGSTLVSELVQEAQRRLSAAPGTAEQPPSAAGSAAAAVAEQPGAAPPAPADAARTPGFGYTLDLLDNGTPANAVSRLALDHGVPVVHTGDRLAIRFITNLPGLVVIENIDANQTKSSLGMYTVFPGADNRVPRDPNKGIKMFGSTGLETFRVNYYPCVTDEARTRLGAQADGLNLPACPAQSSATSSLPAAPTAASSEDTQVAGKRGNLVPRTAMNEEIVGGNTAVTVATTYRPGQSIVQEFQLNHVPAGQ